MPTIDESVPTKKPFRNKKQRPWDVFGGGDDPPKANGESEVASQVLSASQTAPAMLLTLIDRDAEQPRKHFDEQAMAELAESIRALGVLEPISLRPNPDVPGRFLINFGERRYRAAAMAGLTSIPYILGAADPLAQMVENLQREDLTPMEVAQGIARAMATGMKRADVARALSKTGGFITQHLSLLDMPEPIQAAFDSGRCRDVTAIHELVTMHRREPEGVTNWLSDTQDFTRSSIKLLREFLEAKRNESATNGDATGAAKPIGTATNQDGESHAIRPTPAKSPNVKDLERQLEDKWHVPVSIDAKSGGKGRLTVVFGTNEVLDGLLGVWGIL